MTSLISSTFQKSHSTLKIPFFTPTNLHSHSKPNQQPKPNPKSSSSLESSISKLIFSPKLRHRITNFVFFVAFSSSCLCVGARSFFPNYGFHSSLPTSKTSKEQESSSSSLSSLDLLRYLWKSSSNSIDPHHLPIYQNSIHSESGTMNSKKQRRWIEEQSP